MNLAMSAGLAIAGAARAAARNRTVRRLAMTAGVAAAKQGGPVAQARYAAWRDRRIDRDRAIKLARQIGRVRYKAVRRIENELADSLVNEALDAAEKGL